jgi:hypothetical protein
MNNTDKISVSFCVAPTRGRLILDALKSLLICDLVPSQISCYFNPVKDLKELKDAMNFCFENKIEVHEYESYTCLSKLFNDSIIKSKSEYHLISNDDVIFKNPAWIKQVLMEHERGHHLVKASEAFSAFSISKRLVNSIGFFDENFSWAWEDADYRLRMIKFGIEPYEILPNPVEHLRYRGDLNYELFDKSSEYFFKKWDIAELLVNLEILREKRELDSNERKALLFSGFFGDRFYCELSKKLKLRINSA